MKQDSVYLREISRALAGIHSLQRQGAQPTPPKRFRWVRGVGLVSLAVLALSIPYAAGSMKGKHESAAAATGEDNLGIQKLIRQVQKELAESEKERLSNKLPPLAEVKQIEVDITLVAKETDSVSGSATFHVATAENQHQATTEKTHTLKLFLDVVAPGGSTGKSEAPPPTGGDVLGPTPPASKTAQRKKGRSK